MIWSQLCEGLARRRDVAAICSRYGYDSLDELLEDARDDAVADRLVADLVMAGPVGIEVAVVVLAPRLRRAIGGKRAWTGEDIAVLVVAACWERLSKGHLPPRPTRSVVGYARKKVLRQLQRSWRQAEATVPLLADYHVAPSNLQPGAPRRLGRAGHQPHGSARPSVRSGDRQRGHRPFMRRDRGGDPPRWGGPDPVGGRRCG